MTSSVSDCYGTVKRNVETSKRQKVEKSKQRATERRSDGATKRRSDEATKAGEILRFAQNDGPAGVTQNDDLAGNTRPERPGSAPAAPAITATVPLLPVSCLAAAFGGSGAARARASGARAETSRTRRNGRRRIGGAPYKSKPSCSGERPLTQVCAAICAFAKETWGRWAPPAQAIVKQVVTKRILAAQPS
jgi:hypothetical protein